MGGCSQMAVAFIKYTVEKTGSCNYNKLYPLSANARTFEGNELENLLRLQNLEDSGNKKSKSANPQTNSKCNKNCMRFFFFF